MRNSQSDRRSPWLRMSEWLHASAWLPPGLALVWLATLATLVHDVGIMLADWGATVSLVVLVGLLVQRRNASRDGNSPGAAGARNGETVASSAAIPTPAESPPVRLAADVDLAQTTKPSQPAAAGIPALAPRVLTAEEVASVLRVDIALIITSITKGELPGNRIGSHWRIDQGALTRWLQGPYGEHRSDQLSVPE